MLEEPDDEGLLAAATIQEALAAACPKFRQAPPLEILAVGLACLCHSRSGTRTCRSRHVVELLKLSTDRRI